MLEKLQRANEGLKTIPIKGKNYVMVKDRVSAFRREFDGWSLLTDIVATDDTSVTVKATVYDENDRPIATGYANEVMGSNNINRTSHVENAETSAIGRALGLLGIGIDDSFGSADEVANAQMGQKQIGPKESKIVKDLLEETGADVPKFLAWLNVSNVEEMTMADYARAVMKLEKKKANES